METKETTIISLLKSIDKKLGRIDESLAEVLDYQDFAEILFIEAVENLRENLTADTKTCKCNKCHEKDEAYKDADEEDSEDDTSVMLDNEASIEIDELVSCISHLLKLFKKN